MYDSLVDRIQRAASVIRPFAVQEAAPVEKKEEKPVRPTKNHARPKEHGKGDIIDIMV
jgi:hypothetical protein